MCIQYSKTVSSTAQRIASVRPSNYKYVKETQLNNGDCSVTSQTEFAQVYQSEFRILLLLPEPRFTLTEQLNKYP